MSIKKPHAEEFRRFVDWLRRSTHFWDDAYIPEEEWFNHTVKWLEQEAGYDDD